MELTNTKSSIKTTPSNSGRLAVRVIGFAAIAAFAITLIGCNATKGLGEDLQESSDNVKNAGK